MTARSAPCRSAPVWASQSSPSGREPLSDDALTTHEWLEALATVASVHRVQAAQRTVVWRRWGRGSPLVLLHGGHGNWMHWARNVIALSAHHEVWVPDLPGYGASDLPPEASLEAMAQAIRSTLATLVPEPEPMALLGFSFGGLVAAQLASMRPAVTQLALLGPAGHGGTRRPKGELRPWRPALKAQDQAALREVMRHNLLIHMIHAPDAVDELALTIHTRACAETRFRSKPLSRATGLPNLLAPYTGRLLVAWGEHDVTADPPSVMSQLNAPQAICTQHTVAGAGHWVQFEAADSINRLLNDWLAPPTKKET